MGKTQLFLLHFAGGNYYSFQEITRHLKDFDTIPLELPGRGARSKEPLLTDFSLAAQDIYQRIIQKRTTAPFLIYGHSMGAYLALRVTNMLEKEQQYPVTLIVSGNAGPGMHENKNRHLMSQEDFIAALRKLGGVSEEFLNHQELFNFFEPILRADFAINELNNLEQEPATLAPIFAMMGSREEKVKNISNWARFTRADFNSIILEGDHFFIHKHPQQIADIIREVSKTICFR